MELLPTLCGLLPSPGLDSPTLIAHSQAWQLASSLTRQTSHIVSVPQLGEWGWRDKGGKPISVQKRILTPLLLPQVFHSDPWGLPDWRGLGWGTDGIIKPGPCAMTRGIKIIPDLAPRAPPCSAHYPPKRLPDSPSNANYRPKQHSAPS